MENRFGFASIPGGSEIRSASIPGLELLWGKTRGDRRIRIAILDGPVDLAHPCFSGAELTVVENLIENRVDDSPACHHGTHVASVIFGQPGGPVPGVAPRCSGLILPIFRSGRSGGILPCSQIDLARAIQLALQQGAHVINISGGQLDTSGEGHPFLIQAIQACAERGVLVVAAAGNNGCRCLHLPAAVPFVLPVGAMDGEGRPLPFSNWGTAYQDRGILAPGEAILGAVPGGGVTHKTGTSSATPIVSGVVGLLLGMQLTKGHEPDVRPIRKAILGSAVGCEEKPVPECERLLVGRLNVFGALNLLEKGETMDHPEKPQESIQPQALAQASARPIADGTTLETRASHEPAGLETAGSACISTPSPAPMTVSMPMTMALPASPAIYASHVEPSGCGCGGGGNQQPSLAYALGQLDYDFETEARRDSFLQQGLGNPHDPMAFHAHLEENPASAAAVTWVLTQDSTPIYALRPGGAFAAEIYATLRRFLKSQYADGVERFSIPGYVGGTAKLASGQSLPVIWPDLRGMYGWSTPALIEACLGKAPSKKEELDHHAVKALDISNFLERVYYELRNLGTSPQERAINFAATNAFQARQAFTSAIERGLKLDSIEVERSPICRPESDCWDVKLTFFHPSKRLEQARRVYRFTVDVSDVLPVTVGKVRTWDVH